MPKLRFFKSSFLLGLFILSSFQTSSAYEVRKNKLADGSYNFTGTCNDGTQCMNKFDNWHVYIDMVRACMDTCPSHGGITTNKGKDSNSKFNLLMVIDGNTGSLQGAIQ